MLTLLLNRPFEDTRLSEKAGLDLRNVGSKVWPKILSKCRTTDLRLCHVTLPSLEGIESLRSVRRLVVEWAPKVADLTPLFNLRRLTTLWIFDVPKAKRIDGIEQLTDLTELKLSGNRGSLTPKMRLASIEPVTRIAGLVSFSLTNARLDDDDITVLARCSNLKHLHLSNQFERRQIALLAKRLNHQLVEPLAAGFSSSLQCKKCDGYKFMFAGRRMPVLCPSCESARFEKYMLEFEKAVRDA